MPELLGKNFIGGRASGLGTATLRAFAPGAGKELEPSFSEATASEVDEAVRAAADAFESYRSQPAEKIAAFLEKIADEIVALGEDLLQRAHAETGIPLDRLTGERARTTNQLRMFADVVRDGSWRDPRIDRAIPDRKPLPKPDIRRMLIPIGPVGIWGASNFPFAFSVAGGDTASALAAGNPVVVKAHQAHPGASEMVANAIRNAIRECGLPSGVCSMVHGASPEVSLALVRHPLLKAAGFTGSLRGGRALYDAACQRPDPIPFFAEMGSINPVFLLPGAIEERGAAIAEGLTNSMTAGVGQFCTNPGVVVGLESEGLSGVAGSIRDNFAKAAPGTMLHPGILKLYEQGIQRTEKISGVRSTPSSVAADAAKTQAKPTFFETEASGFLSHAELREENFGPTSIMIRCKSPAEMAQVVHTLEGSLTATVHGNTQDLANYRDMIRLLETKVGRLIINGYPTGLEVCASMNHGGPYPATTDVRYTSVGTASIQRFCRPICYQNFPQELLPVELRDENERKLWRTVDGRRSQE